MRIDPVTEQDLRPVHVSDTGQDGLVHQECRDRPGRTMDPAPGKIRIGVRPQRVGAEHSQLRGDLGSRTQHAELRPAKVRNRLFVAIRTGPGRGAVGRTELEAADEAQMDMKKPVTVESQNRCLPCAVASIIRVCPLCRRLCETALRTADRHHPPAEGLREVESEPVQRVPFRQGSLLSPSGAASVLA